MKKVYTKTGDDGTTGLIGGRTAKDNARVQTYGDIDEADSVLGLARTACKYERVRQIILEVQKRMKQVMAETASVQSGNWLDSSAVEWLESCIDELSGQIKPLEQLILPGGRNGSAWLHVARTVVRRAERSAVALNRQETLAGEVIVFLNRLSDLCFTMARYEDEFEYSN